MELLQRSFEDCGPWMYPVLALSIVVLAVVVERTVTFVGRWGVRGDAFLAAVEKLVRHGNLDRALRRTRSTRPRRARPRPGRGRCGANASWAWCPPGPSA